MSRLVFYSLAESHGRHGPGMWEKTITRKVIILDSYFDRLSIKQKRALKFGLRIFTPFLSFSFKAIWKEAVASGTAFDGLYS